MNSVIKAACLVLLIANTLFAEDGEKDVEKAVQALHEQIHGTQQEVMQTQIQPFTSEMEGNQHVILAPYYRTVLSAQLSSPVQHITKRMGESFKEGELLIQLDNVIYEANIDKTAADLEKTRAAFTAKKELYTDKIASFLELKEAEANLAKSKAENTIAIEQNKMTIIKAPYSGKVVNLSIEEYELPQVGQPMIELVDDDKLLAKILIPSSELKNVTIGNILNIKIHETGAIVSAKIIRIGAVIDPSSSTLAIDAEIDNRSGQLKAGMIGSTTLAPKQP